VGYSDSECERIENIKGEEDRFILDSTSKRFFGVLVNIVRNVRKTYAVLLNGIFWV